MSKSLVDKDNHFLSFTVLKAGQISVSPATVFTRKLFWFLFQLQRSIQYSILFLDRNFIKSISEKSILTLTIVVSSKDPSYLGGRV